MINVKVHANVIIDKKEIKLEDIVNISTYIYSRIINFNMKHNSNNEMVFFIEYEVTDNEFLRLDEIINTNIILGSELTYLNIDTYHVADSSKIFENKIDIVTVPYNADMELQNQNDYYVFGKRFNNEVLFWGRGALIDWFETPDKGTRFRTLSGCLDTYCHNYDMSLRYAGSWDTCKGGYLAEDIGIRYFVFHIINDVVVSVDYYEELKDAKEE